MSPLGVILLCGCAVGPDYVRPTITQDADYSHDPLSAATASADVLGGASQRLVAGMDIPGLWWTLFRSPALNELVDEAMRANPDVAAAQASLRQANELVYADRAALFPTVGASVSTMTARNEPMKRKITIVTMTSASANVTTTSSIDVLMNSVES